MLRYLPRVFCMLWVLTVLPWVARAAEPQPARAAGAGVTEVVVVFKTTSISLHGLCPRCGRKVPYHDDRPGIGRVERDRSNAPAAVHLDGAGLADDTDLGPGPTPERRERITRAIREGQLVWHALPLHAHRIARPGGSGAGDAVLQRSFPRVPPAAAARREDDRRALALLGLAHALEARPGVPAPGLQSWESISVSAAAFLVGGADGSRAPTCTAGATRHAIDGCPGLALSHLAGADPHERQPGPAATRRGRDTLERGGAETAGVKIRLVRLSDFSDAILREKAASPVVRGDMPRRGSTASCRCPWKARSPATSVRRSPRGGAQRLIAGVGRRGAGGEGRRRHGLRKEPDVRRTHLGLQHVAAAAALRQGLGGGPREGTYDKLERSFVEKGQYIRDAQAAVEPALARTWKPGPFR